MTARHASPVEALLIDGSFDGDVFINEPMSKHTSYAIGGPARFFVRVGSIRALTSLRDACVRSGVKFVVVGRGSNLLVSDAGFDGVVITLGRDFRNFHVDAERAAIVSGAGTSLSSVVQEALRNALTGMEFAVGTPGSVGGALRMNAGSATDWIGSRVASVTLIDSAGNMVKRAGSEVEWGYRHTSFLPDETLLECELALSKGDPFFIQGKMEASLSKRKRSQPLGKACCGSVFRNPEGASAAKLIDDLGLKGTRVGAACVSEKHANFIVNEGGASAADVLKLIELVAAKVEGEYGIKLTPEVRFLGF